MRSLMKFIGAVLLAPLFVATLIACGVGQIVIEGWDWWSRVAERVNRRIDGGK